MYWSSLSFKLSRISESFSESFIDFFSVLCFCATTGSFFSGRGFIKCFFGFTCGFTGWLHSCWGFINEDWKVTNLCLFPRRYSSMSLFFIPYSSFKSMSFSRGDFWSARMPYSRSESLSLFTLSWLIFVNLLLYGSLASLACLFLSESDSVAEAGVIDWEITSEIGGAELLVRCRLPSWSVCPPECSPRLFSPPTPAAYLSGLLSKVLEAFDASSLFLDMDFDVALPSSNSKAGSSYLNISNIFCRSFLAWRASIGNGLEWK